MIRIGLRVRILKRIWSAIWQYLPDSLRPANADKNLQYSDLAHKRKDHLSLCFEIAAFDWGEIKWIRRWDDWHQIAFRPALIRDRRILRGLGGAISKLVEYPSRRTFRQIVKGLGEAFPTKRLRDTMHLSENELVDILLTVIKSASS